MKYYYIKSHKGIFCYYDNKKRLYGFRFKYRDGTGKRHEKSRRGLKDLDEAVSAMRDEENVVDVMKHTTQITFGQWSRRVISEKREDTRETTYKAYEHLLNDYVVPYIGDYKLVNLTPMIYKHACWTKLLDRGLSHNTVIDTNAKVQSVMNSAVRNGILKQNPLKHPEIPRDRNVRPVKQIMTRQQLKSFNKCLEGQPLILQVMYFTLERTGMRAGELLGLHWHDVDLKNHIIHIKYTRDAYGLRRPKTRNSRRSLTIDDDLNALLSKYYEYSQKRYHIKPKDFVIRGRHGRPLIPKFVAIDLKKLLKISGLKKLVGKFTAHTFRHMFASKLIVDYKVDPLTVSRILGHSSPAITMKIYAQLSKRKSMNIGKILNKNRNTN